MRQATSIVRYRRLPSAHLRIVIMAALSFVAAVGLYSPAVEAKAPPLATVIVPATAYVAPDYFAEVVAFLPVGSEVELTGNAAPGFLGIVYEGAEVFVPAQALSLGVWVGIDTAVTTEDAPLLSAPLPEADVLSVVPQGETVILTGAALGGYVAASYQLTGGWMERAQLAP